MHLSVSLVFVVDPTNLKEGFAGTATTSNNTNSRSGIARACLLGVGGQMNSGLVLIRLVANDGSIAAGHMGEGGDVDASAVGACKFRMLSY
jgi:hypothetical protein